MLKGQKEEIKINVFTLQKGKLSKYFHQWYQYTNMDQFTNNLS